MKLQPIELANMLEYGEGHMAAATFRTQVPGGADLPLDVFEVGGAICVCAPELSPYSRYNMVFGLGLREPVTASVIGEIVAHFQGAGAKGFGVGISPAVLTDELAGALRRHGFERTIDLAKFYRATADTPVVETELRIARVGPEFADAFAEITYTASGLPQAARSWLAAQVGQTGYHFMAFEGPTPVAAAALYVMGNVASLHMDSTLPAYRGQGAQKALQAARIQFAAECGCQWVVTETPNERPGETNHSYRAMLRTGFQLGYLRPHFNWNAPQG